MRLIDADALKKCVIEPSMYDINAPDVLSLIDEQPPIDAVPVIRCKDCKHWKPCAGATEHVKCCEWAGYMVRENGYCAYGEVKGHD